MRGRLLAFLLLIFSPALFGSDLKIKVLDPQSAVVPAARVAVYDASERVPLSVMTTGADGIAEFRNLPDRPQYKAHVLAAGFAAQDVIVRPARDEVVSVQLARRCPLPTPAQSQKR